MVITSVGDDGLPTGWLGRKPFDLTRVPSVVIARAEWRHSSGCCCSLLFGVSTGSSSCIPTRRHPLSTATIGRCACLFSPQWIQTSDGALLSTAIVGRSRFQTDWASSERDRQRTRPTGGLVSTTRGRRSSSLSGLCSSRPSSSVCRRQRGMGMGEKGCCCCCGLQGSCFEKGNGPQCSDETQAGRFVLSQQQASKQQPLPTPTWSPVRGCKEERMRGGWKDCWLPLLRPPSSQFTTNTSSKPGQTGTRPRRGKDPGFRPRLPATGARSKVSRREERALA